MLRFKDAERELRLSVHDVIDAGPPRGSLELKVAWSATARMRVGRKIHIQYQKTDGRNGPIFSERSAHSARNAGEGVGS